MSWLLLIVFEVCSGAACHHEQFLTELPEHTCLADKAAYDAGSPSAQWLTVEAGADAGARYPVVAVDCIPPDQSIEVCEPGDGPDQSIMSAYPQE
jgi:hypothetical protein